MAQGIDFMAIARGRQQALDDNYKDIVRLQQQEQYAYEREKRAAEREQNQFNRIATTYTAPWMLNIQQLTKGGLSEVDAYLQGLSIVQNDPGFQSLPPEAQSKVLEQIQSYAVPITQRLAAAGDVAGIEKISAGLGVTNPVNPLAAAINSGDIDAILTAAGYAPQPGATTINVGGQEVPKSMLAARLAQTGQRAGAIEAAEQARIDAQTRGQLDAQTASRIAAVEAQYVVGAGFVKQPDGTLMQPSTGQRIRINEQGDAVLAPTPSLPGATGQVGVNTVLRDPNVPAPTPEAAAVAQANRGPTGIDSLTAAFPLAGVNPLSTAFQAATGINSYDTARSATSSGIEAVANLIKQANAGFVGMRPSGAGPAPVTPAPAGSVLRTAAGDAIEAATRAAQQVKTGVRGMIEAGRAPEASRPGVPSSLALLTQVQTEGDIEAGQSDATAALRVQRSPEQRKAIMLRLQMALATAPTPVEKVRIQAAIERYRRIK